MLPQFRIRPLRELFGLTQRELASSSDIDRARLCLAELDQVELRPDELEAIEKALCAALEERLAAFREVLLGYGAEQVVSV